MPSSPPAAATDEVRRRLRVALGPEPARPTPAPAVVGEVLLRDGIRLERWSIAGPRGSIPAWFLAPAASHPSDRRPALLALHGHGRQFELGKSTVAGLVGDPSRAYALAAAREGFAVLAPDLVGFEDHRPTLAARKASYSLQGEHYERLLAMQALVRGETLQGMILGDLAACVDALVLDPRVDGGRIGALGQSYGGQETIFAMAVDDRVRAGVSSCGFSLVRLLVERDLSHNLALYLPGMLPDLDLDRIVASLAPRSFLAIAGLHDAIYPVEGVRAVERAARQAWSRAGHPERLEFRYFAGPHDLPPDELAHALSWLRAQLDAGRPAAAAPGSGS